MSYPLNRLYSDLVALAAEAQAHALRSEGITSREVRGELYPYLVNAEDYGLAVIQWYADLWKEVAECKLAIERFIYTRLGIKDYLAFCELGDDELVKTLDGLQEQHPDLAQEILDYVQRWHPKVAAELRHRLRPRSVENQPAATVQQPEHAEHIFRRDGDGWFVRAFGVEGHFKALRGLECLGRLLAQPGASIPLEYLVAEDSGAALKFATTGQVPETVIDKEALKQYHHEIKDYDALIEQALRDGRVGDAEHLQAERKHLIDHIAEVTGLGGKLRHNKSESKKLRDRIQKALKRTYEALRQASPPMSELADHLEAAIQPTEDGYVYMPTPPIDWRTQF